MHGWLRLTFLEHVAHVMYEVEQVDEILEAVVVVDYGHSQEALGHQLLEHVGQLLLLQHSQHLAGSNTSTL